MTLHFPTEQGIKTARACFRRIEKPGTEIRIAAMLFEREAFDHVLDGMVGAAYEYGYILPGARPDIYKDAILFHLAKPLTDGRRSYVSPDRRHHYTRDEFTGIYSPTP